MRVTAATFYKDYAQTVQDLHSKLNDSMDQISSGKKYKNAKESPLDYYSGKKIDNEYTNVKTQDSVISDVTNRMYQQEESARAIQTLMRNVNTDLLQMDQSTYTGELTTLQTLNNDVDQRMHSMVDNLNATYENYYVLGGNDMTTVPFKLTEDLAGGKNNSITLRFSHKFPGMDKATIVDMRYSLSQEDDAENGLKKGDLKLEYRVVSGYVPDGSSDNTGNGKTTYKEISAPKTVTADNPPFNTFKSKGSGGTTDDAMNTLLAAMEEEGAMNLGYGTIGDRETLPDTFYNGLNMLTGLNPSGLKSLDNVGKTSTETQTNITAAGTAKEAINKELYRSPLALTAKIVLSTQQYIDARQNEAGERASTSDLLEKDVDKSGEIYHNNLNAVTGDWTAAEQRLSDSYRRIGLTYSTLQDTQSRLQTKEDTLESNYKDRLGIDPYDAIVQMYSQQFAYTAAMRVGSNIMQSSLFDFVR